MLLLTRKNIPNDVEAVITGSKLLSNPSNMIPLQDLGIYKSILSIFNFDLNNPTFESLELKSNSTVFNSSSFFILLVVFLISHYIIRKLKSLIQRWESANIWNKLVSVIVRIFDKVLQITILYINLIKVISLIIIDLWSSKWNWLDYCHIDLYASWTWAKFFIWFWENKYWRLTQSFRINHSYCKNSTSCYFFNNFYIIFKYR